MPIGQVIDQASVVVSHGGAGTVLAALSAGVPQVVLPRGADQFAIAGRAVEAGVALQVEAEPAAIGGAVTRALDDDRLVEASRRVRGELESMASPARVVAVLEGLVEAW